MSRFLFYMIHKYSMYKQYYLQCHVFYFTWSIKYRLMWVPESSSFFCPFLFRLLDPNHWDKSNRDDLCPLKRLLEHIMGHKLNTLKSELRRRHTRVNQLPNQRGWASMHLLPPSTCCCKSYAGAKSVSCLCMQFSFRANDMHIHRVLAGVLK